MKNILIKGAFIGLAATFMTTACDDFLEQEVPNQFAEQDFYKTDVDALQAVNAIYDATQNHMPGGAWQSWYLIKTLPSDESNAGGGSSTDQEPYQELDDFLYGAENPALRGGWRYLYGIIYRANKVINKVEPINPLRERLIAEAKVLRAYHYLELVSLWGDVPLVLQDVAPSQFQDYQRESASRVYEQIEQDLSEAIPNLPTKSEYPATEKWRVSSGAAKAILGKAHLYQEEWQQAAAALEDVINSGVYDLEPSVGKAITRAGEFGVESLLETSFVPRGEYSWGNFPWGNAIENNIHVQLMGPRIEAYTPAPGDSLIGGWGFNTPTQKIWDAILAVDQVPVSERRRATIMSEEELVAMGGAWSQPDVHDYEGFIRRKYGTFVTESGDPVIELNYGTNFRLVRYADVLLMAAEANFRLGNEAQALEYLNRVRQRSELVPVAASGDALFMAIVNERFAELAFEGHRFQDLIRWNMAAQELGDEGFRAGRNEFFPIPDEDIRVAGLQQNPGY